MKFILSASVLVSCGLTLILRVVNMRSRKMGTYEKKNIYFFSLIPREKTNMRGSKTDSSLRG